MITLLTGCIFISNEPYTFRQSFDQIESIDILKKEYDSSSVYTPMAVIKTLDEDMHQAIIDALLAAEGSRVGLDGPTGFGFYIIRITYKNGEAEMIGNDSNGYINPNGEIWQDCYCFDSEQFYSIISRFLGEEVTPPKIGD